MLKRLLAILVIAAATCTGVLWWLHDGDLQAAVEPALTEWDAPTLARDAGVVEDPVPAPPAGPDAE